MAADQLMSIKTVDAAGRSRTDVVYFLPATTLADIQLYATAYIPALDAAIGSIIQSATVTLNLTLPGPLKGVAVAGVDNRVAGLMTFDNGSRFNYGHYFHGLLTTSFAGDKIDMGLLVNTTMDAALRVGLGGVAPSNGHGFDVGALVSTKKSLLK